MRTLIFCFTILLFAAGCSKNNNSNTSIVGTWQLTHFHEEDTDASVQPAIIHTTDSSFVLFLQFKGDSGSCFAYTNPALTNGIPGGYHLIGNDTVSFSFGPGPPPSTPRYTIQGTTLTFFYPLQYEDSLHSYRLTETFIRIR